jgi:phosphoglycerate kinase
VADRFEGGEGSAKVVPLDQIPDGWLGLDHGPESTAAIRSALQGCRTVLWNGPMGVFEQPAYAKGTYAVAEQLAALSDGGCITVIGGGDSVAAVNKALRLRGRVRVRARARARARARVRVKVRVRARDRVGVRVSPNPNTSQAGLASRMSHISTGGGASLELLEGKPYHLAASRTR